LLVEKREHVNLASEGKSRTATSEIARVMPDKIRCTFMNQGHVDIPCIALLSVHSETAQALSAND